MVMLALVGCCAFALAVIAYRVGRCLTELELIHFTLCARLPPPPPPPPPPPVIPGGDPDEYEE